jgi:uncharacterized protein involved in type VI secretion and phage assembly
MNAGTLASNLAAPPTATGSGHEIANGLVAAIVTNIEDPSNLGRVKVKFPWLADNVESGWARVVAPGAGNERGLLILPEVNDEVVVGFLHGNFNSPYVLGGVWNNSDKLPTSQSKAASGGNSEIRQLKTRIGHMITLDDKSGSEKIEVKDSDGNFVLIDTANKLIHLKSAGDIMIEATGDVTVKSGKNIAMKAQEVKADGSTKMALKAPMIDMVGSGPVTIKGTPVGIN